MTLRDIGRSVGEAITENVGRAASRVQEATPLAADVLESEDAYLVVFDAPGVTASDIQVRYDDGHVLVRIDRFREFYEGFEMRFPGRGLSLDGSVRLPEDALVDAESATATLRDNGTLEVEVPKREAETIEVDVDDADEPADDVEQLEDDVEERPEDVSVSDDGDDATDDAEE